ncbi:Traf3ip1 [Symbiodinium natans]|uniref:Traf3ip1 protein n=1 Tax=Symbiodinium natans TaxID=878477 RepID=A0A812Q152_9DINO|nr:Traf3ip1 [Symbiodinium natans]
MAEAAETAEETEPWIQQTQATLGTRIARPRMLPERLRKPPFRFLYDIAAEVARQTNFGALELFGGDPGPKPEPPQKRDDKVDFLQRWIALVAGALPAQAVVLEEVSAVDVVCGANPDKTNFLLQCLAQAAWQEEAPVAGAPEVPAPVESGEASEKANPPPPVPQAEARNATS